MANERIPNDPYRADDLTRPDFDPDAPYRRKRLDNEELQPIPNSSKGAPAAPGSRSSLLRSPLSWARFFTA
ncbi:MAG TPA: hypothetical protein VFK01_02045 [Bradyrhizobium sp.]|nr:hypothetical protein [Bradyrhizobium sp.]